MMWADKVGGDDDDERAEMRLMGIVRIKCFGGIDQRWY